VARLDREVSFPHHGSTTSTTKAPAESTFCLLCCISIRSEGAEASIPMELNKAMPNIRNNRLLAAKLKFLNKRTYDGLFLEHSQITRKTRPTAAITIKCRNEIRSEQSSSCPLSGLFASADAQSQERKADEVETGKAASLGELGKEGPQRADDQSKR